MLGFYASYVGKTEVLSVPKCVLFAVGGCRVLRGVGIGDGEGRDEVELNFRVYGHVGELDSLRVSTNVLAKKVGDSSL